MMTPSERQVVIDEFRRLALLEVAQGYGLELCLTRWLARWATLFDPPIPYPMPALPARAPN